VASSPTFANSADAAVLARPVERASAIGFDWARALGLVGLWVVAVVGGGVLTVLVQTGMLAVAGLAGPGMRLAAGFVVSFASGVIAGTATGLVLRPYLPYVRTWVTANAFGTFAAFALSLSIVMVAQTNLSRPALIGFAGWWTPVASVLMALVMSLFQWLVLRRVARHAWVWVVVATATMVAVSLGGELLGVRFLPFDAGLRALAVQAVPGAAVSGLVGGVTLAWLFRERFRSA
jgi:hypothetical protein